MRFIQNLVIVKIFTIVQFLRLKEQKLDDCEFFDQHITACVEASFEVASPAYILIVKLKKALTVGETFVKPFALKMILEEASVRKRNKCLYQMTRSRGAFHLCQQTSNNRL